MTAKWVRTQADGTSAPRRVVIRYHPNAAENAELERLLAQIPYGLTNKTWLECLRAGAKAMLRTLDQRSSLAPAKTMTVPDSIAAPSPAPAVSTPSRSVPQEIPAASPSDGKSTAANQTKDEPTSPAVGFSKAAQRMFDQ